MYFKGVNRQRV